MRCVLIIYTAYKLELEAKLREIESFTITEKTHKGAFSYLKVPSCDGKTSIFANVSLQLY